MISDAPTTSTISQTAREFVQALLPAGHEVELVFFYHGGASIGLKTTHWPSDELNEASLWLKLAASHGFRLMVCSAAGQRRGVVHHPDQKDSSLVEGFEIGGLPQWLLAAGQSDRHLEFGAGRG